MSENVEQKFFLKKLTTFEQKKWSLFETFFEPIDGFHFDNKKFYKQKIVDGNIFENIFENLYFDRDHKKEYKKPIDSKDPSIKDYSLTQSWLKYNKIFDGNGNIGSFIDTTEFGKYPLIDRNLVKLSENLKEGLVGLANVSYELEAIYNSNEEDEIPAKILAGTLIKYLSKNFCLFFLDSKSMRGLFFFKLKNYFSKFDLLNLITKFNCIEFALLAAINESNIDSTIENFNVDLSEKEHFSLLENKVLSISNFKYKSLYWKVLLSNCFFNNNEFPNEIFPLENKSEVEKLCKPGFMNRNLKYVLKTTIENNSSIILPCISFKKEIKQMRNFELTNFLNFFTFFDKGYFKDLVFTTYCENIITGKQNIKNCENKIYQTKNNNMVIIRNDRMKNIYTKLSNIYLSKVKNKGKPVTETRNNISDYILNLNNNDEYFGVYYSKSKFVLSDKNVEIISVSDDEYVIFFILKNIHEIYNIIAKPVVDNKLISISNQYLDHECGLFWISFKSLSNNKAMIELVISSSKKFDSSNLPLYKEHSYIINLNFHAIKSNYLEGKSFRVSSYYKNESSNHSENLNLYSLECFDNVYKNLNYYSKDKFFWFFENIIGTMFDKSNNSIIHYTMDYGLKEKRQIFKFERIYLLLLDILNTILDILKQIQNFQNGHELDDIFKFFQNYKNKMISKCDYRGIDNESELVNEYKSNSINANRINNEKLYVTLNDRIDVWDIYKKIRDKWDMSEYTYPIEKHILMYKALKTIYNFANLNGLLNIVIYLGINDKIERKVNNKKWLDFSNFNVDKIYFS